jgi:hypothetical protein
MNLETRISALVYIGRYLLSNPDTLTSVSQRSHEHNRWFIPEYIKKAGENSADSMLRPQILEDFSREYQIPQIQDNPKIVGLIMAGNIPYVGFHDLVCTFLWGHKLRIKLSSKDPYLIKHLIEMASIEYPEINSYFQFEEMLKGCDAYIATGSNNSARYFEYYFKKYPHIIRKNKTSIAILEGNETLEELSLLADDIQLYFGLGCRNVTQVYVPEGYDFVSLLNALRKYDHYREHAKYMNNFDYQLTIAIMNNQYYMSNDSIVLIKNESAFSPIGQLHYQFYTSKKQLIDGLIEDKIQCTIGREYTPWGTSQLPKIRDYADGIDTMAFLQHL